MSEYIKICDENVAAAIYIFKHLKDLKYSVKTEGMVCKEAPAPF